MPVFTEQSAENSKCEGADEEQMGVLGDYDQFGAISQHIH